uniref:type II toxin-antitoxin system PemK/MazF family toxin n=1 Tax=Vaginimicrobium propionicum TaxID=1871034 RepID=UPI0009709DEE|nr:type II toxin-antitoxin system PemK/MazF family toxin [Vaginimicrobium propionicum]
MRGEIWTVCASGYASKPRPAVIVQADSVVGFDSTIVCLFTTDDSLKGATRVSVKATGGNGLTKDCIVMAEKPVAINKSRLGEKLGALEAETLSKVGSALRQVFGFGVG